jgi:hypothetical protein
VAAERNHRSRQQRSVRTDDYLRINRYGTQLVESRQPWRLRSNVYVHSATGRGDFSRLVSWSSCEPRQRIQSPGHVQQLRIPIGILMVELQPSRGRKTADCDRITLFGNCSNIVGVCDCIENSPRAPLRAAIGISASRMTAQQPRIAGRWSPTDNSDVRITCCDPPAKPTLRHLA